MHVYSTLLPTQARRRPSASCGLNFDAYMSTRVNSRLRGAIGKVRANFNHRARGRFQRNRDMVPVPMDQSANAPERGQEKKRPGETLATGWRDIVLRIKIGMRTNNISVVAAGVAFFAHLSTFAALAAIVAVYGLVANPDQVPEHLELLTGLIPQGARVVLTRQLSAIIFCPRMGLGIGLAVGVLVALWSARTAMRTLMAALNIVYGEEERRAFLKPTQSRCCSQSLLSC